MNKHPDPKPELEDDTKENMSLLIEHRLPWLVVGLMGGIVLTLVSSRFQSLLEQNIPLAFFIPVIVYMAGAVGTQTETVYVRNLGKKRTKFSVYLVKELLLGVFLGHLFGALIGLFAFYMFNSVTIALTVGSAMLVTMSIAPLVGLVVPTLIQKEHKDPALGAGPFVTVIQDFISLSTYFIIATLIIL